MIRLKRIPVPFLSACLCLFIGCYQLWRVREAPIGDFANYYYASQAYQEGALGQGIYEPYAFNLWVNERSPAPVFLNYAPVPPVSILAYLPFAGMEEMDVAKFWFSLIGLLLFVVAYYRLGREVEVGRGKSEGGKGKSEVRSRKGGSWEVEKSEVGSSKSEVGEEQPETESTFPFSLPTSDFRLWIYPLFLPLLCWTALYNNFFQGQSYLYIMAMLMEGYRSWASGKRLVAALLWSLPIALKIFPAILFVFLWLKKDWVTFLLTGLFASFFSLIPLFFLPFEITYDYFSHILPRLFSGEINDPFTILYQSMRVLLDKLLVFDLHLNPTPIADIPYLSNWLYALFQWVVLSLLVAIVSDKQKDPFVGFAMVITAGLLISGYGSSYSMLMLLLPLIAYFFLQPSVWFCLASSFLLFLAGNIPIYLLKAWPLPWQFPRLYALLVFLGIVVWYIKPRISWKPILVIGLFLIGKEAANVVQKHPNHAYYLPDGRQGIIYDYQYQKEGLLLTFFNAEGANQQVINTQDTIWQDPQLTLTENQIYYSGQQLTFNHSRKLKPLRLNDTELIFLSDEGRGVGFYTLRKMPLP
ncbi:MAG: glycosyltransferase family 87 protein [Saprospiraceae bacterium]